MNDTSKFRYSEVTGERAWPVFVTIDTRDGAVAVDVRPPHESGVSLDIWHGLVEQIRVDSSVNADVLDEWIASAQFQTLVQRVVAGTEAVWNGSNTISRYLDGAAGDDARGALEEITALLEQCDTHDGVWAARDWDVDRTFAQDITTDTTDDEITSLVAEWEYGGDGRLYVVDLREYLESLREDARASVSM